MAGFLGMGALPRVPWSWQAGGVGELDSQGALWRLQPLNARCAVQRLRGGGAGRRQVVDRRGAGWGGRRNRSRALGAVPFASTAPVGIAGRVRLVDAGGIGAISPRRGAARQHPCVPAQSGSQNWGPWLGRRTVLAAEGQHEVPLGVIGAPLESGRWAAGAGREFARPGGHEAGAASAPPQVPSPPTTAWTCPRALLPPGGLSPASPSPGPTGVPAAEPPSSPLQLGAAREAGSGRRVV